VKSKPLPWAVRYSIVRQNRVLAPHNRDPHLRTATRQVAARLSQLSMDVWDIEIDWRKHACELDQAARVVPISRAANKEMKEHAKIALSLRKAVHALRSSDGQVDPMLLGALQSVATLDREKFDPYVPRLFLGPNSPRLSDFLNTLAAWIEGEGLQSFGFHRLADSKQRLGFNGAALVAHRSVSEFMVRMTGKPLHAIVSGIVDVYFPEASQRDRARSARIGKTAKK
jgi:hypothetical protein